jgi:hypothetical protein
MDIDHVGNPASVINTTTSGATILRALTERSYQLLAKLPVWKSIEGGIYILVRNLLGWIIGVHPPQSATNPLRKLASHDQGHCHLPENTPWGQSISVSKPHFFGTGSLTGYFRMIAGWIGRSLDLPANCGGRTAKKGGYLPDAAIPFQFDHNDCSSLNGEAAVLSVHGHTLYHWYCTWN